MDVLPTGETALLVLGIVLAVLQIIHTLMGISKNTGGNDAEEPDD